MDRTKSWRCKRAPASLDSNKRSCNQQQLCRSGEKIEFAVFILMGADVQRGEVEVWFEVHLVS
jgi:hypothetical protein